MKKYYAFLIFAAVLSGCTKQEPQQQTAKIRVEPVITKATETDFQAGDKIGLSILHDAEAYAVNKCYTYDGTVFTGDLDWYTSGEQESVFTAYYPYAEQVPSTFSVSSDQSGEGYTASDLMGARKEGVTPQSSVAMVFRHLLTRIVVNIDNQAGASIEKVVLKGSKPTGTVDFEAMAVTADPSASAADINMNSVAANTRFAAVVIPQTVKFSVSISVKGGNTITKTLTETTLKPAGQYSINATILPTEVKLSISGEIENWSDEGEIPEKPGKEISFHEYDTFFEYDGANYNTVTLPDGNKWMAQNMHFVPENKSVSSTAGDGAGIWNPYVIVDGAAVATTDEAVIARNGYLYDINTILSAEITSDNFDKFEGARGICPPGWHVPTRAEYYALCGNSNACARLGEKGVQSNPDAFFYDSAYSSGTVKTFNDGGFNFYPCGTISNSKYGSSPLLDDTKCDYPDFYGLPALTFFATSTANTEKQYFALMSTFTSVNKAGKLSLAFVTLSTGAASLRCVKDK